MLNFFFLTKYIQSGTSSPAIANTCTGCAAGTRGTDPPSANCYACPLGSYSLPNSTSCSQCYSGLYGTVPASSHCVSFLFLFKLLLFLKHCSLPAKWGLIHSPAVLRVLHATMALMGPLQRLILVVRVR